MLGQGHQLSQEHWYLQLYWLSIIGAMKQGHICTRSHWGLMLNTGILEPWGKPYISALDFKLKQLLDWIST